MPRRSPERCALRMALARAASLVAAAALACAPRRSPHASTATARQGAPPGVSVATADAGGFPPGWTAVAPGVTWRGARVAFDDPPPDVVAWATSPRELVWVTVRLDLARVTLGITRAQDDHMGSVTTDPGVLAAVDCGFFEPDDRPSGLLAAHGAVLGTLGAGHAGSGVLRVTAGVADVLPAAGFDAGTADGVLVQCGPRLVERGGVRGVHRDDGHRYARTAACVRDGGRTLDLVATWDPGEPLRGPGLFQFARMLAAPSPVGDPTGCELALNLDGGPSTGVYVRGGGTTQGVRHDPVGPTPWLLVVRAPRGG